jgi:hypothetical protein
MSYSMNDLMSDSPSQSTLPATPQPTRPTAGTPSAASPTSTGTYSMSDLMQDDNHNNTPPPPGGFNPDLTPQEYAALPPDKQKEFDQHVRAGRSILDPATGFLKGVGETVNTLSGLISRVAPSVVHPQDVNILKGAYTATPGTLQGVGKVGENIAEFFLGDEALKGLSVAEKLGLASKVAKLAESNPVIARIVEHGLTAVRGGTVVSGQQLAHGATPTEALKTGAEATVLGTGTGAALEGVSALADSPIVKQIRQGRAINQPGTQAAVRSGLQSSVDTTNAAAKTAAEASQSTPVEKYPVSVEHDADGNVISADGRHRVVEAWEKGDKTIPVTTKLADGSTEVINQTPEAAAKKMGLGNSLDEAKASLEKSDATQPYRAPNGKPRQPVYAKPQPQASSDMTPVKLPDESTPLTRNQKATIVDDHLDALEQQKAAAYKRIDDAAGFDVKALKDKLKTDQYNLKQLGSSDPDKTGRLVEAINESTDRIAEANAKMKAAGIDPASADALNTRWKAGQDFKKSLLNAVDTDGNYDPAKLWKAAKTLRTSKYGDRLEQFFGSKEAADEYVSKLAEMDKLGAHAVKARWVAGALAVAGLAEVGLGKASSLVHVGAAALP